MQVKLKSMASRIKSRVSIVPPPPDLPLLTGGGVTVEVPVEAAVTVSVACDCTLVPPAELQVSVYVKTPSALAVSANDPDVGRMLDQPVSPAPPPFGAQEVALVDDQVNVKVWPSATDTGLTDSVAVGWGPAPITVMVVCALTLP
jgi:hypothetical protein